MKDRANYKAAWRATCIVLGLLGLGNILDKNPDTSWATVPIVFACIGLYGFAIVSVFAGKDGQ